MDKQMHDRVEEMIDYIMKKCLWQFHSRIWDRERQNEGVLGVALKVLCDEPIELSDAEQRCYWVDAVCLVDAYKQRHPWLLKMDKEEIKVLWNSLKERLDYLTISGSLNEELTDKHY